MLIAQALGEYLGASAIAQAVTTTMATARTFLSDVEPETWAIIACGVMALLVLRNRFGK